MDTSRGSRRMAEGGQVIVLVAAGFIAFVAIVGLVLDGGVSFLNRRDAQNASDLGSLAGARVLAMHYTDTSTTYSPADVHDAVRGMVEANQCTPGGSTPCSWDAQFVDGALATLGDVETAVAIPVGAVGVRVGVHRQPRTYLTGIFGQAHWDISTEAVSTASSPSTIPAGSMLPIALCGWSTPSAPNDCAQGSGNPGPGNHIAFAYDQIYDLTDGKDAPGGFAWISWDGSNSAAIMADRICTPQNESFTIDDPFDDPGMGGFIGTNPADGETWFPIDPGKSNNKAVRDCLDEWILAKTPVLIPIYDIIEGGGNAAWYHVTGVAVFILTSREQPAVDNLQGSFVRYYSLSDEGPIVPPSPDDAFVDVKLAR